MLSFLKTSLASPLPFSEKTKDLFMISIFFGLFVFCFLSIFQPFELSEIPSNKFIFISGFGLITFFTIFLTSLITPTIIGKRHIENWTVTKFILLMLLQILLVTAFNWFYTTMADYANLTQTSPIELLSFTLAVGFFPIFFYAVILEKVLKKKKQDLVNQVTANFKAIEKSNPHSRILIGPENQSLDLAVSQLSCIKADGNYIEVYYFNNNESMKEVLRFPLSKIIDQIKNHPSLKHCHRSYIANFDKIEKVSGNARNFNLHLSNVAFPVPVSRNFPSSLIKSIKN